MRREEGKISLNFITLQTPQTSKKDKIHVGHIFILSAIHEIPSHLLVQLSSPTIHPCFYARLVVVQLLGTIVLVSVGEMLACVRRRVSRPKEESKYLRIILISVLTLNVVLVIHVLDLLLGVVLGLLSVYEIHSLGLSQFVDLGASEAN